MSHTLEQFAAQCHDAIKAEPGPAGRRKVAALLQEVLKDTPVRHVITTGVLIALLTGIAMKLRWFGPSP